MSTAAIEPIETTPIKSDSTTRPRDVPRTSPNPLPSPVSWMTILAISVWFGIVAGGIEGLYWTVHQWRTDGLLFMHPGFLWISPTAQAAFCALLGIGPAVYAMFRTSTRTFSIAVTSAALVAWLNLVDLLIPGLQAWAWLSLGCGLAAATWRIVEAHTCGFKRVVWLTLPWMTILLILTAIVQQGSAARRESAALGTLQPAPDGAPNVLLIVLDTIRADAVLSESGLTPNISRFASRGVQFTAAKATAPWTLPSQAGMFTGRLPHEISSDWRSRLDDNHTTLAEVLSENGWVTGGFVGNTRYCSAETGLDRGFSHYEGFCLSGADFLYATALGRKVLISPIPQLLGLCDVPGRKPAAEINGSFLDWVEKHPDHPFFAFLNYWDAHDPYFAPEEFQTQSQPTGEDLMLLRDWWWIHKERVSEQQITMLQTAYEDCIRGLDDQIGKLLQELEARGKLENTLVIITADHGEHFGDHDLFLHGNSLYDAVLGVPLKIVFPQLLPAGAEVTTPVSLQGLPNTVIELLGVTAHFPGASWTEHWGPSVPSTTGLHSTSKLTKPVISEIASQAGFPPCHGRSPVAAGPMQCVQFGQWKYIRDAFGTEQLFDLQSDPDETKNHAATDGLQNRLEFMRNQLRAANPGGALSPWPTIPKLKDARLEASLAPSS